MSDYFLIPVILAMFVSGYFIIKKFDSFIDENQRKIEAEKRKEKNKIRIAAENQQILESAKPVLDNYCAGDPWTEIFLKSGSPKRILEELSEGKIDIVLLSEEHRNEREGEFSYIGITAGCDEKMKEKSRIYAFWKKGAGSKNRDWVIFALGNGIN